MLEWKITWNEKFHTETVTRNKDRSHSDTRVFRYLAQDILFSALSRPFYIHLHIRGHSAGGLALSFSEGRAFFFSLFPTIIKAESNRWRTILSTRINPLNNLSRSLTRMRVLCWVCRRAK